jgi:hypothetical protein
MKLSSILNIDIGEGLQTFVVWITPQQAKLILEHLNIKNRRVTQSHVDVYVSDMIAQRWTDGSPIVFFPDGTLADGQHRLLAVVASNVAVRFSVIVGVPFESKLNHNQGKLVSAADVIRMTLGTDDIHGVNTKRAAQYCRSIVEIEQGRRKASTGEIMQLLETFKYGLQIIAPYSATNKKGTSRVACWAGIIAACYYVERDQMERFCSLFIGVSIPTCEYESVPLRFANDMLRNREHGQDDRKKTYLKTQRAIKAFVEKEPLAKFIAPAQILYSAFEAVGSEVKS